MSPMTLVTRFWAFAKAPGFMAIVAIVSLLFAFYQTYFYEKRPELQFEVKSSSKVFDVNQNVAGLEVTYAGQQLNTTGRSLRLLTLRISNSGQADITKASFDDADLPGFKVESGQIIERPRLTGSNQYLSEHASLTQDLKGFFRLQPIILESGDFVEVQLLAIGPDSNALSVVPVGKVAGVKHIGLSLPDAQPKSASLWQRVTAADSFYIQVLRAPLYAVFALALLPLMVGIPAVLLAAPFSYFSDQKKSRSREKRIREYSLSRPTMISDQVVFEYYRLYGTQGIQLVATALRELAQKNEVAEKVQALFDEKLVKKLIASVGRTHDRFVEKLATHGLANTQDGRTEIDADVMRACKDFAGFLGLGDEFLNGTVREEILQ